MSILDRVREKFQTPMSGTSKTSESPSAGFAGTQDRHLKSCGTPSAGSAGAQGRCFDSSRPAEPPSLTLAQQDARSEVLARLSAHPAIERAFVTRWEAGNLIVTLAIRGVGTGELVISGDRIDRDDLQGYALLLGCLDQVKS